MRLPNIATRLLDRDEDAAILSRLEDDRVVPTELFRAPCWPERSAEVEGERRRVARVLRAAGFEAIYTGLHQTPEMIASAAVHEDVDVVGLSIMSGAHNTLFPAVIGALAEEGRRRRHRLRRRDHPRGGLERLCGSGVKGVFTPGAIALLTSSPRLCSVAAMNSTAASRHSIWGRWHASSISYAEG